MKTGKRRGGVPKHVSEDLNQRDLAVRRLGATWKDRLRWVVHEFARRDLTAARPEELLALGYDLRALTPPIGTITRSEHTPMPPAALRRLHADVNAGLRRILSPEVSFGRRRLMTAETAYGIGGSGGWTLPSPKRVRIVRVGTAFMRVEESRNEAASVLAAIAEHIVRAGDDLRTCPECGRPFIRTGRRKFCEERCSMRVRNRKRPRNRPRPTGGRR